MKLKNNRRTFLKKAGLGGLGLELNEEAMELKK
jgi:hypothetical protein